MRVVVMSELTDAEINRRVAETMGLLKRPVVAMEAICVPGQPVMNLRTEGPVPAPPDFIHDWQAFGRLVEHIRDSRRSVKTVCDGGLPVMWLFKAPNPRRALALAFLQVVSK